MPAPTITPLPTPPSRSTDPTNFAIEADAFVAALPEFATDANAQASYLDGLATAVDADAAIAAASASIAAGAANYQGDYNAGTTYQIGQSVSYSGRRFVAKTVNTGVTPVDGANWLVINDGDVTGPSSATANGVALYDGTTGKLIKAGPAPSTAGNLLTSDGTTWVSSAPPSSAVNYPQNSQSANYTLVIGDAGKQIFHPASDGVSRIYTIPSNASVPFSIGTVVLFTVENGGTSVNVAINSDTLVLGSGLTGTAPVSPNNTLMAIKVTATKWMANYLTQDVPIAPYVFAISHADAGIFQDTYPFTSGIGFGTRYANPVTTISGNALSIDFAPSGDAVVFASNSSPFLDVYRWSGNGYGTRYANAASPPANALACATFSSQSNAIAAVNGSFTPTVEAWRWDSNTGFGTKYSNPATATFSATRAVAFHPLDTAVAVSNSNSPFINAYAWTSASGFGTKFANPATLPANGPQTGTPKNIAFSPAGDAVAMAHSTTPFVTVYAWSASGFGTKFANPATLPVSTGFGVAFSPLGDAIAVTNGGSPAVTAYPWSGAGFGTKYSNPATLPTGSYSPCFSPNGDTLAVGDVGSPFIRAYPFNSATGFGTIYPNPSTLPTAAANDIASTYNF
jgi:hypothetical protein